MGSNLHKVPLQTYLWLILKNPRELLLNLWRKLKVSVEILAKVKSKLRAMLNFLMLGLASKLAPWNKTYPT